jgi:cellulose synthase/poly-beta-1,6-N-acetylglucosamine synthase-like glycosyltransferase
LIVALLRALAEFFGKIYEHSLWIYAAIGVFLSALTIHLWPFGILGFFATRKYAPAKKFHKYAILIPGRNEEPVIGNLIESIKKQDYPSEYLTIFVVADNCTDNTAKVARDLGAVCYEHNNPDERTKGFALKYLFEQIEKDYGITSFEGYFIFDADNLLNKDFVSRMNDSFDAGDKIITSYRNTKNFNDNWIAAQYGIHWMRSIRFRHRPRSVLHLATNIQGTGFLFSSEIVKDGWKYTSLTEDRAMTADCVVAGYEIAYNNEAMFYDEQPVNLRVALRQRLRWAKGHLQAFEESGWGLFKNIFINKNTKHKENDTWYRYLWRNIRHRFMAFDTFAQLVPRAIFSGMRFLFWSLFLYSFSVYLNGDTIQLFTHNNLLERTISFFTGDIFVKLPGGFKSWLMCIGLVILIRIIYRIGLYINSIFIAIYVFIVERKNISPISLRKKIWYCITWPIFDIIDRYAKYVALFVKVEWKPIPHNSSVTIDDLTGTKENQKQ